MAYTLQGKLIELFAPQQVSHNFKKREFVVETSENANGRTFSESIKFQVTQDRCNLLDKFKVNDHVKVTFNIKGKRWEKEGKVSYFTNLEAWKIEPAGVMDNDAPNISADFMPDQEPMDDPPF